MAEEFIPGEVRQFINDRINSIAELEGLLLLCRDPEMEWTVPELAQRLYISEQQAGAVATHLRSQGFLSVNETGEARYRYAPSSTDLGGLVGRVAEVYSKYLIPITNLIHAKSESKIQQFADAFKFRNRTDDQ